MADRRHSYSSAFKAEVVLEAIKGNQTSMELADRYNIHPGQIRNWKSAAIRAMADIFSKKKSEYEIRKDKQIQNLYRSVEQLQKEMNWLRENLGQSRQERMKLINRSPKEITVCHKAELLGISRSS